MCIVAYHGKVASAAHSRVAKRDGLIQSIGECVSDHEMLDLDLKSSSGCLFEGHGK